MKRSAKHCRVHHPKIVVAIVLLALLVASSLATVAWAQNNLPDTQFEPGTLKIAKVITGDMPEGGPWTPDDFSITVTGPGGFWWTGSFPVDGPIVLTDLVPGTYTVTENATGTSWIVTGTGAVTVNQGPGQTGLVITNEGVTTTTTTEETTTTTEETTTTTEETTTTTEETTTTTEETTTTTEEPTTSTAPATTATTAPPTTQGAATTTPIPSEVATGGGGTAGMGTGFYAIMALAAVLVVGLIMSGFRLASRHK